MYWWIRRWGEQGGQDQKREIWDFNEIWPDSKEIWYFFIFLKRNHVTSGPGDLVKAFKWDLGGLRIQITQQIFRKLPQKPKKLPSLWFYVFIKDTQPSLLPACYLCARLKSKSRPFSPSNIYRLHHNHWYKSSVLCLLCYLSLSQSTRADSQSISIKSTSSRPPLMFIPHKNYLPIKQFLSVSLSVSRVSVRAPKVVQEAAIIRADTPYFHQKDICLWWSLQ